ncbi:MAG TPA: type II toxin-antitoxin system VapC family toxin [Myxococcota bacterium]|nr:type II toxin-antitoxin system VapC family toxin [Myxococcota bacterium]
MESILVDTHAFLWFVFDDHRLSENADQVFSDRGIKKVLSIASLWEIAVKVSIEKLNLGMSFPKFTEHCVQTREIDVLAIRLSHLTEYIDLPLHHRDPFDRLLIAQARVEHLPLLTSDKRFSIYGLQVLW